MAHFLYISEIFCPWCYGFSPTIKRIKEEYQLPFDVMCGALIESPTSLYDRLQKNTNIEAFIDRLHTITGVRISDNYVNLLRCDNNKEVFLDSQRGGLLFYTLKHFAKQNNMDILDIMEDLQTILYDKGQDVLSPSVLESMAHKHQFDLTTVKEFHNSKEAQEEAYNETEESFDILEDIVLYPTLFYVTDKGERIFISRGFVTYEKCKESIENAINQGKNTQGKESDEAPLACSLDNPSACV